MVSIDVKKMVAEMAMIPGVTMGRMIGSKIEDTARMTLILWIFI